MNLIEKDKTKQLKLEFGGELWLSEEEFIEARCYAYEHDRWDMMKFAGIADTVDRQIKDLVTWLKSHGQNLDSTDLQCISDLFTTVDDNDFVYFDYFKIPLPRLLYSVYKGIANEAWAQTVVHRIEFLPIHSSNESTILLYHKR